MQIFGDARYVRIDASKKILQLRRMTSKRREEIHTRRVAEAQEWNRSSDHKDVHPHSVLNKDGTKEKDERKLPNIFEESIKKISGKKNKKSEDCREDIIKEREQIKRYEDGTNAFVPRVITAEMVYEAASNLKHGKANGVGGVPMALYKHLNSESYENMAWLLNGRYEGNVNPPHEWTCIDVMATQKDTKHKDRCMQKTRDQYRKAVQAKKNTQR